MKRSIVVWVVLLMFTKMNNLFTGITLLLIISSYIVNNFIEYYNHDSKKNKETLIKFKKVEYILIG